MGGCWRVVVDSVHDTAYSTSINSAVVSRAAGTSGAARTATRLGEVRLVDVAVGLWGCGGVAVWLAGSRRVDQLDRPYRV
jgi:hypothetical protein